MDCIVRMTEKEQDDLVETVAEAFPAAAALKMLRLGTGSIPFKVKTPVGDIKGKVGVEITPNG